MITLNLFPARIPIGTVKAENVTYDVLMTPEFARALSSLLDRVGGESNYSIDDLALLAATQDDGAAQDAALSREVAALRQQVEVFSEMAGAMGAAMARIAQLEATLDQVSGMAAAVGKSDAALRDIQIQLADVAPPTDWEHPGRIGAGSANTGSFSTLNTGVGPVAGTAALPSFYLFTDKNTGLYRIALNNWGLSVNSTKLLDIKNQLVQVVGRVRIDVGTVAAPALYFDADTGTGLYRVSADVWGHAVSGVQLVKYSANLVTITGELDITKQIVSTLATGTAPFIVASTTLVGNLYVERAQQADNAATAGIASQANSLTSPSTYSAPATDLPSAIILVNELRAAALTKGL